MQILACGALLVLPSWELAYPHAYQPGHFWVNDFPNFPRWDLKVSHPKRKIHLPSIQIFQLLYLSFRESICIPSLSSRVYFYCLICLPPTEADPNPVSLALRPQSLHRNATCWVFSCRKVQRTHRWTAWKIFWNDGDTELMKSDKNTNGCQKQQVFVVVVVVAVVVVSVVSVVVCTPRLNCKNNLELNMFRIWRWIKRSPGRK